MINLAYITSTSYSGSTLLTLMLNRHPGIATVGELKWGPIDTASYLCSCGDRLVDCRFWRDLGAMANRKGLAIDWSNPGTDFRLRDKRWLDNVARARIRGRGFECVRRSVLHRWPGIQRKWPAIRFTNFAIIEAALSLRKGLVFVDSSKDPVRAKHLIETGDYRVRVIHLIRDGRGFVHSAMRHSGMTSSDAAREWARTHDQVERLRLQVGEESFFRLRYEDFCARPTERMNELVRFLELPQGRIDWSSPSAAEHHIVGNRMRLQPDVRVQVNETWREELSREAEQSFQRIAGIVSRRYGSALGD